MNLLSKKNARKIQDLLLNKIDGLTWNYFDLDLEKDLGKVSMYAEQHFIEGFFDNIETDLFGKHTFCGDTASANHTQIVQVLNTIMRVNPKILRDVTKRLFDVNEIRNDSEADEGPLGKFNRKNQRDRNKIYKEKIRNGHRANKENITILAEGDSWFQFPRVYFGIDAVTDIVDWLIKEDHYAIHSLAAGGDWFSSIFHSGEYIEELPKVAPDVFLFSGGGNDLVGNNRLAVMVINPLVEKLVGKDDNRARKLIALREKSEEIDIEKYTLGLSYISEEFFNFINIYFIQYLVFFSSLSKVPQYQKMLMIVQGYDYPLPYNGSRANMLSMQRIFNEFVDTGAWLFEPLNMKAITDPSTQEAILYAMITEFNEMLVQLVSFSGLPNLFHIDCRGIAQEEDDWFDELHLKSHAYKVIAEAYKDCIKSNLNRSTPSIKKVYRAIDYR